jgi:hypothetical protein
MRKLVLLAICCSGLFYAPVPLNAQNGGGPTPLIPVADMPSDNGAATAPSDPPLEVDADQVPQLIPSEEVGGGAQAPAPATSPTPTPTPAPEPAPAPAPTTTPAPAPEPEPEPAAAVALQPREAQPAQDEGEEPVGSVPEEVPTPTEPDEDTQDEEQFEEEFDDEIPEPGEPESRAVAPRATAGPQLPRTGADLPALLLSGLALTVSGMSLRALCRARS